MNERILIIDDDTAFIELLELRLQSILENPEFKTFNLLADAEKYLQSNVFNFDLVIIDQHLPDGLGSDFIKRNYFQFSAVLSMSSDDAADIPAKSIGAGANFFLSKKNLSAPLFAPMIHGLIQRNTFAGALYSANKRLTKLDTIRKLISTLRHEINNPLAAIIGSVFLLRKKHPSSETDEGQAVKLIEASAERIKTVLGELGQAEEVAESSKADEKLFMIPGDPEWDG